MKKLESATRCETELVGEECPGLPVHLKRGSGSATPVQGEHQLFSKAVLKGVFDD